MKTRTPTGVPGAHDGSPREFHELACVGFDRAQLPTLLRSRALTACGIYGTHTCRAAWGVLIELGSELAFEVSAFPVLLEGWWEAGVIRLEQLTSIDWSIRRRIPFDPPLGITNVTVLEFEHETHRLQCGLILSSADGRRLVVSTAAGTGSVSIALPNESSDFRPEFPLAECRLRTLA